VFYSQAVVRWLSRVNVDVVGAETYQEMCDLSVFVLEVFAQHSEEKEIATTTINTLVSILQLCDREYVSDALAIVLQHPLLHRLVKQQLTVNEIHHILTMRSDITTPLRVFTLLTRWPLLPNVVDWVLLLHQSLLTVAPLTTLRMFISHIPTLASNGQFHFLRCSCRVLFVVLE
jgi:hypothetical protein